MAFDVVPDRPAIGRDLDWDMIWPIALIALGIGILLGAWNPMSTHSHGPTAQDVPPKASCPVPVP